MVHAGTLAKCNAIPSERPRRHGSETASMQRVYLFASVKSTYPSQILVDPTLHPAMIIYPQMPQISQIEFDPFFKSVQSAKSVDRLCCGSAALTLRVASGF